MEKRCDLRSDPPQKGPGLGCTRPPTCSMAASHRLYGPHVAGGGHTGHPAAADRGRGRGVQAPFLRLLPVRQESTPTAEC